MMFCENRQPNDVALALIRYVITLCVVALINDMTDARATLLSPQATILPDIGHTILPFIPEMAKLSDTCLLFLCLAALATAWTKPARCDLFCEFLDLHMWLLLTRCFTVPVTILPSPMPGCAAKLPSEAFSTLLNPLNRVLMPNFLTAWCHDLMYSGHTIIYALTALFIFDLQPNRAVFAAIAVIAIIGALCLLVSHVHYTVDVIVAFIITTLAYAVRRPKIVLFIHATRIASSAAAHDGGSDTESFA